MHWVFGSISMVTDKAIQDCKEILDVVLEGKVSEWLE